MPEKRYTLVQLATPSYSRCGNLGQEHLRGRAVKLLIIDRIFILFCFFHFCQLGSKVRKAKCEINSGILPGRAKSLPMASPASPTGAWDSQKASFWRSSWSSWAGVRGRVAKGAGRKSAARRHVPPSSGTRKPQQHRQASPLLHIPPRPSPQEGRRTRTGCSSTPATARAPQFRDPPPPGVASAPELRCSTTLRLHKERIQVEGTSSRQGQGSAWRFRQSNRSAASTLGAIDLV